MSPIWKPTLVYGLAHFAVDLGCAFAVFSAFDGGYVGFLLYNFCAFALQMPLGLVADAAGRNRRFAVSGTLLVALVCCLPSFDLPGIMLLGLGNALFHIGGGLDVLNLSGTKAAPLGVFVSPGAYGIYFGTLLGNAGAAKLPVLFLLLAAAALMGLLIRPAHLPDNAPLNYPKPTILPWAALLFAVVVLRSYGGLSGSFSWKTGLWSFAAVSAVVLGKAAGGFCADRWGALPAAAVSLLASAALFCFADAPLPGTLALFLFNMTMPITLFALAQVMPGCKGFSFGVLTFALFLGFLPSYLGAGTIRPWGMALVALVSALLLLPGLRKLDTPALQRR